VGHRPGDGGAADSPTRADAGSGGGGGQSGGGGGAAPGTGGAGAAGGAASGGGAGSPGGSSGTGGAGIGGSATGGRGPGGAGGGGAGAGAGGSGTGGRGGGAGAGGSAAGGSGTGGRGTGGAGSGGTPASGGSGTGGRGTGGAGSGGAPGTGGSNACPTPPAGAVCGCGARLDCNGVCQPAGTCNAIAFDGTTGSITHGATTALAMNQSATIEAWVQVRSHIEHAPIFRKVLGNEEDKALSIEDGHVRLYFYRGGPAYIEIVSRTLVPLNAWTHIAGVYDGTNISIYMNGDRTDTAAVTGVKAISNSNGEIFIGRVHTMYEVTFDGVISDLRVSSIGRYTTTTFTPPALHAVDGNTLALWRLDEGAGATVTDVGTARLNASILRNSTTGPPRWVSASVRR
jgi:hypothetical protein